VPLGKPDPVELHPDIQADQRPQTFHNYLDEFLLAVRVFGFLEKPVSPPAVAVGDSSIRAFAGVS
jgi:lysophospholipid hydrolase